MQLTFLGTGTSMGIPVITCNCPTCTSTDPRDRHLRTSALITTDAGNNILIDIGPDFREQMLREKITRVDTILITHAHRDHVGGIDDIRPLNYAQQQRLPLYANEEAMRAIRHDYHYIFENHIYPGLPEVDAHVVSGEASFSAAGETIVPIKAMHKTLPILGYRIGRLAYMTDANHIEESELKKMEGVDTLVINALRKEHHFSHFSLPEALKVIERIQPREAYLTHVSHELGLYEEVSKILPSNVHIAYDGLKIAIGNL